MNAKLTTRFAWGLGLTSLALTIPGFIFLLLSYSFPHVTDLPGLFSDGTNLLLAFGSASIGFFLAAQRPRHPIGWLLLALGFFNVVQASSQEYALYGMVVNPGALPAAIWVTWLSQWAWSFIFVFLLPLLLLFPTGRLLSPRWKWLAIAGPGLYALFGVYAALLTPMYIGGNLNYPAPNPFSVFSLSAQESASVGAIVNLMSLLMLFGVLVGLLVRFRRSRGIERVQMKWFAYAAVFAILTNSILSLLPVFGPWTGGLSNLAYFALLLSIAIAILRYRLYDIDLVIRRTLVYAVLTALLAFVYLGSVVVLQQFFRAITGQQQSELVTIISTLGIAALFNPIRRRVQGTIDLRFFRRKYDAAKVLAAFGATVRDQVEIEELTENLIGVVSETMQPSHVSLWLKRAGQFKRPEQT